MVIRGNQRAQHRKVLTSFSSIIWNLRNTVYVLLWVACGGFSAWAAFNGNKLFAKLLQGEQIIENADPEIGLPEIDTQLPVFDATDAAIGRKRLFSDVDENFNQTTELKTFQNSRRPSQGVSSNNE